ncbi:MULTISPECIES: TetR/AcrR family transcriptional regulator [unclassified Novosphingobium]|uniref:TetR/AcrR family transcriptional regulator n=1 Tax=unclassified Novosphingobium TaxID=2644732 RepID=UPI001357E6CD|nr:MULTISPECIES: TetR/AcrR family transcriptional regulator [unclassified Novosphingobium]
MAGTNEGKLGLASQPRVRRKADPGAAERGGESSRDRFLDAADQLFIREGYDRCTIRAISATAGTSLALLSRHWDSKHQLFEEVFRRHFEPIHSAQQSRFDILEAQGPPDLRAVLEAFFSPALAGNIGPLEQRTSHLVYCRALMDPSNEARTITRPLVRATRERLIGLLRQALPQLDETRFFLAMATVLGAYIYPQVNGPRLAEIMGVEFQAIDWAEAALIIPRFLEAGLRQEL